MADEFRKMVVKSPKSKVNCKISLSDIAHLMWKLAEDIEKNVEDYKSGGGRVYLEDGGYVNEWLYQIEHTISILDCLVPQHINYLKRLSEKEGNRKFLTFTMGDDYILERLASVRHLYQFPENVEEYYLEWEKARLAKNEI